MAWEHFEIKDQGLCKVFDKTSKEILDCQYELGIVSTGKQRVFWGYRLVIYAPDFIIVGSSKGYSESYRPALRDCNEKMTEHGLVLLIAGNVENYSESAMSGGSGYGYLRNTRGSVNIMSYSDAISETIIKSLS